MKTAIVSTILLPTIAGVLVMFLKPLEGRRPRKVFVTAALSLHLVLVMILLFGGETRFHIVNLSANLPMLFKTDMLARVFAALVSAIFLLIGISSFDYMEHEGNENRFYAFFLMVLGMLSGLGFSGSMLTFYLFFEFMTFLSMPLIMHSRTKEATAAAFKYIFYSIAGASLALVGFFFIFVNGSSIEFTPGGTLMPELMRGGEQSMLLATLLTIIGFGAKAGLFPLHMWLPAAHPQAPAPASAILSGVIAKAGILGIIRFVFYLVGAENIRGTWVQYVWMGTALISVFTGSAMAYREQLLKKRLAFSTISQVSYIVFGLSTLTATGVTGSLLHLFSHSIIKDVLFIIAGIIIFKTGKTDVRELSGIGKQMPATMWCFTIASLGLSGIPPTTGFVSKWLLAQGSLSSETGVLSWLGPAVLLASALFTAGYLLPILINGFFPGKDFDYRKLEKKEPNAGMLVPVAILTASILLLGMFPGFLINNFNRIATLIIR